MTQAWPRGGDPQAAKVSGTPTDGQGLAYDAATGFWLPVDLASTATFATDAELAAHEADTTSIHGIADTSVLATDSDVATVATDLSDHLADTTDAHDAAAISYAGETGMTATDVEGAIDELALASPVADSTVGASGRRAATQTIGTGTNTDISWDTQDRDDASLFTPTSVTFLTADQDGWWDIEVSVSFQGNSTGIRRLHVINPSGSIVGYSMGDPDDASAFYLNAGAGIYLTAGQTMKASVFQNSGGDLTITGHFSAVRRSGTVGPQGPTGATGEVSDAELTAALALLVPAGSIIATGRSSAPTGWLLCDGSSLLRASYADLFTAIGTTYGSVDGTHFTVPDLRGRVPMGVDGAAARIAANDALGNSAGAETHGHVFNDGGHTHTFDDGGHTHSGTSLTMGNATDTGGTRGTGSTATPIFSHTHAISGSTGSGTANGTTASGTADGTTDPGSGLQPYQVVNYIIKT